MRRNLLYIALCATSLWAMTACSDDAIVQENNEDVSGKSPIELSVGVLGEEAKTRAITVEPSDASKYRAFKNSTQLYMVYKCEDLSSQNREAKYTKTIGLAGGVSTPSDGSYSSVDFDRTSFSADQGKFPRYWDDAYARESALSIFAIAYPGCNAYANTTNDGIYDTRSTNFGQSSGFDHNKFANLGWKSVTNMSTTVTYSLQNQYDGLEKLDMCYSNNISKYTPNGGSEVDKRMKFNSSTKKFDQGKMVFYHIASKMTFVIKRGDGFTSNESFSFPSGKNIKLKGFYDRVENFDVASGELAGGSYTYSNSTTHEISKLWEDNTNDKVSDSDYTLRCLVFPSTDMSVDTGDDALNAVTFTINNNKYIVTRKALFDAIKANASNLENGNVKEEFLEDRTKLKAGVHYIFTFTIAKTKISGISAQVVAWEKVTADEITPSNARISLSLEDRGTAVTSDVDFYRAKDTGNTAISDTYEGYNWSTGYTTNGNKANANYTNSKWIPSNWYWPDNTTYYHFRALSPTSQAVNYGNSDYTSLTADSNTYTDVMWGAPFKDIADGAKLKYSTTYGFDGTYNGSDNSTHQIYKGIGPTDATIKLLMFHMMSEVTFKVQTTSGDDKVMLIDGSNKTKIHLEKIKTTGTVAMGNGLVTATGDVANKCDLAMSSTDNQWVYGAIPQSLEDVVLVITTPDKNEYRVAMKDVIASSVSSNNIANPYTETSSGKYAINAWYPGFKYSYTFKLKKTGIEKITATILDWETVTAGDDEVVIQ